MNKATEEGTNTVKVISVKDTGKNPSQGYLVVDFPSQRAQASIWIQIVQVVPYETYHGGFRESGTRKDLAFLGLFDRSGQMAFELPEGNYLVGLAWDEQGRNPLTQRMKIGVVKGRTSNCGTASR